MLKNDLVGIGTKVNRKLAEKASYIIQNKLNMTLKSWFEMKFAELIKEHERRGK